MLDINGDVIVLK